MASLSKNSDAQDHLPARSGTPTAWLTLTLLAALIGGLLFFDGIVCGTLRLGLGVLAWSQGAELSIDHLTLGKGGTLQAHGVAYSFGSRNHRSSWKSDAVEMQISSPSTWFGFSKSKNQHFLHEVVFGKTKVLQDNRHDQSSGGELVTRPHPNFSWVSLLPDAASAGPMDVIIIGDESRLSINGLRFYLPNRWNGRVSYSEAMLDIGPAHQSFGAASAPANWNGTTLQLGKIDLTKDLKLEEFTLVPRPGHLEFGLRGTLGAGLLRGDGLLAVNDDRKSLEVTLVGENLRLESASQLLKEVDHRAGGTIRQGRITFRGDLEHPLEAASSLRLVADDFRWEGRGWNSLRLAATLTGRVFTLTELVLIQEGNEVVAQGESKLPEDWHQALKAPFTASFHAQLDDAGALAALAGPDFAELSGGLEFEGSLKGSENKAGGYCNLLGTGMKIRNMPIDWLKGCLLFEGAKTHLSNLEIWSGKDRMVLEGSIENSAPHTYQSTAQFDLGNLNKRLAQIGISTASQLGGGAVQGTWSGDGSTKGHSGTFQASVNNWVSPWTSAGMSGKFEGSYSPGHLYFSKAEFQAQDLKLGLQLSASPTLLEAKSIMATKRGKTEPLVQGDVSLPVNAPALWTTGALVENLDMKAALKIQLELRGIKVEELAHLFGQKTPCTGTLEGTLAASGTPSTPEIHSSLKISRLTLPDSTVSPLTTVAFDSSAGRASCQLVQDPTLSLRADLPFNLILDKGELRFADGTAPLHADAILHATPLSGWLALWSSPSWMLHNCELDGAVSIGGTLNQPSVEGKLTLSAGETSLPGLPPLGSLKLPISCTLTKVTASDGSALSGTNPVSVAGMLDWSSNTLSARVDLVGKNLVFPALGGLETRGDAELSLSMLGTNDPILAGKLMVKQIGGLLPSEIMPSFVPPGIGWIKPMALISATESTTPVLLDLEAQTEGVLPLNNERDEPTQLQASLYIQGSLAEPTWSGSIQAKNARLDLPAGRFVIPDATLQANNPGQENLSFTAYGMTRLGFCAIQHAGSLQDDGFSMDLLAALPQATEADLILALATPEKTKAVPLVQSPFWIRQNTLFPIAASDWISRREPGVAAGALGFYGGAWSMTLQPPGAAQSTAPFLNENRNTPKN